MNKITPNDVYGNSLNMGIFTTKEAELHIGGYNVTSKGVARNIDIVQFGSYFDKCTGGKLNSILKVAPTRDDLNMVVKDKIGFRTTTNNNYNNIPKKRTNASYANKDSIFQYLHRDHVDLVCKKDKRNIVSDFCTLKEDTIVRFHDIKRIAMESVDDVIQVADVYTIGHNAPTNSRYSYKDMGYIFLNQEVISKDDIMISVNINGIEGLYDSHNDSVISAKNNKRWRHNWKSPVNVEIVVMFRIKIPRPTDASYSLDSPEVYRETKLFSCDIRPINSYSVSEDVNSRVQMHLFDTRFNGIDVLGMIGAVTQSIQRHSEQFTADLESLKEKYLAEFVLSEICDGDGAI